MHAQDRVFRLGADEEARRHHDAIVLALAVDVLDPVDGLDDGLERLGDQLHGIGCLEPIGIDADIDHGDADLRLLLARDHEKCDQPHGDGCQQK